MVNNLLLLNRSAVKPPPFIPIWTRDQLCNIQLTFSGLWIKTVQFGNQPWFELAYQCLSNANDRAWVRQQKKAVGDTHIILEFFTHAGLIYDEPNVWLNQCYSPSGEQNPDWFYLLALECILDGLIPIVVFDGDNGDNPTDGYPNALKQLPLLYNTLADLRQNVVYARFWDGVWYGSSRPTIPEFGRQFRRLFTQDNVLFIEMEPGVIHLGDDVKTYGMDGMLHDYDGVCSEFDSDIHQDSTWQIVDRMVQPFHRPPDMPIPDDPNAPYYLGQGHMNPRGRYWWIPLENKEYEWTRKLVSRMDLDADKQYFKNMGCSNICW